MYLLRLETIGLQELPDIGSRPPAWTQPLHWVAALYNRTPSEPRPHEAVLEARTEGPARVQAGILKASAIAYTAYKTVP
jgi:hypothetical protein